MEQTPHLVAQFMAAGAEKRLEDYHYLRNTYETVSSQEIQLNRILRMLGEDEFTLNWRAEFLPTSRGRSRSVYDFDRWCNSMALKGNIAYERLRELDPSTSKSSGMPTMPSSSSRLKELRERRKRLSEQRELPPPSASTGSGISSSARLQALAEYDAALAETEAKRKRQAEENKLSALKTDEQDLREKRRERFASMFDDTNQKYESSNMGSKQQDTVSKQQEIVSKEDDLSKRQQDKEQKRRQNDEFKRQQDNEAKQQQNDDSKQQQQAEESKHNDYESEQQDDTLNIHSTETISVSEDQNQNTSEDQDASPDLNRKSSTDLDHQKTGDIELIAFTVRWEAIPSSSTNQDEQSPLVRLFCKWASPSSSSTIDYFTIERQVGDQEWLSIGKKIDKFANQTQLDISSSTDDNGINNNIPSYFRLKAHLQNGQTFTSKPTDEIFINFPEGKHVIIPDVEILSPNAVQLTWNDNENEETSNIYDVEKKEQQQSDWEKVKEVPLSQHSTRVDSLNGAEQYQFRLIQTTSEPEGVQTTIAEDEVAPEVLAVHNVNELLNSLHVNPTSSNTVEIDISEEGFKAFDAFKIEYTTLDQPNQWNQMPDITHDDPYLKIDKLKAGTDYQFRFTPVLPETTKSTNATDSSHLSLVLDVKMPAARRGRFDKIENETPVAAPPPKFSIQKIDSTSVLIEAVVPAEEPATFENVFDVYSKKDTTEDDWTKVGTIDKEHLSTKVEDLEENTPYSFKIDNTTSPSDDDQSNTVQEFNFNTTPVKQFDPSLFLEKIEQSLENVVNSVMKAAAGHQALEEPINQSLNEVIKEVFRDETLVPNEEFGFDTLALNDDLLLYRGPKQMMVKELEVDETADVSKHYGEIIIHNYCSSKPSVLVREENGNTRVANIDGDIIIRNVISDVLLKNEQLHHQLSMNIVGQAFLKGVQGTLIASKFKGIIVVKNVHKP